MGKTMPGPSTYSPNKDVILKRVTGYVKFDALNESVCSSSLDLIETDARNIATQTPQNKYQE